jgi:hypothetical protein
MAQLEMFKRAPGGGEVPKKAKPGLTKPSISDRFETFLAGNPHVMPAMLSLAREKLRQGATRIGAKALWEDLREYLKTNHEGDYKLNNDYTALAARRLLELEPKLEGVIELRRRKAK